MYKGVDGWEGAGGGGGGWEAKGRLRKQTAVVRVQ